MRVVRSQQGSMLLECLVGISIFSFGILALSALQANVMRHSVNSGSRTTATQLTQRLDGEMRSNIQNLDGFSIDRTRCDAAKPSAAAAKQWASAVANSLPEAICTVAIQANDTTSTPCSRRAVISINWPTQRGAKSGVVTGTNKGMNESTTVLDIPTILETNDPLETRHLRCGL
jgi:type IV pilus assembly protein PilV